MFLFLVVGTMEAAEFPELAELRILRQHEFHVDTKRFWSFCDLHESALMVL